MIDRREPSFRKLLTRPLGEPKQFYEAVALPQIFVFLILIVGGSLLPEDFAALSQKLGAISYLLLFNIAARGAKRRHTPLLVCIEMLGLAALLVSLSLLLGLNSFVSIYLPISMTIVALTLVRIPWQITLAMAACMHTLLALHWLVGPSGGGVITGTLFVLAAFVVLTVHSLFLESSGVPQPQLARSTLALPPLQNVGGAVSERLAGSEALRREAAVESLSRIGALTLVCAALSGHAALRFGMHAPWIVLGIVVVLGLQAAAARAALWQRSSRRSASYLVLCSIGALLIWAPLAFTPRALPVLVLCAMTLASLPIPARSSLEVAAALLLFSLLGLLGLPDPITFFSLVLIATLIGLRLAAVTRLAMASRAILSTLSSSHEGGASGIAAKLAETADVEAAAAVFGDGEVELVGERSLSRARVDETLVRALFLRLETVGGDGGIARVSELGSELENLLIGWFGPASRRMFFLRLQRAQSSEIEAFAIMPVAFGAMLAGAYRTYGALAGVAGVARGISASLGKSSDPVLLAGRALQDRERELNDTVHLVNNAAQDVAIHADAIRSLLDRDAARADEILAELAEAESCARNLASEVTDSKLARELTSLRSSSRLESVDAHSVANELEPYLRSKLAQGGKLATELRLPEGLVVRVPSRELLATALRSLCRVCLRSMSKGGLLTLKAYEREGQAIFELADRASERGAEAARSSELTGVSNLAALSRGRFETEAGGQGVCLRLALPAEAGVRPKLTGGHWALLVDNNAEVTTFYARVAEALNFRYFTAGSLEAAQEILAAQGEPNLVITDLKLGDSHGLSLIEGLRQRFGTALPIIVVSGDVGDDVAKRVLAAGATRLLTKPVGRRRLFDEIKQVIAAK